MENTVSLPAEAEPRKLAIDWSESEWFQVWLRLAKRGYQGNAAADQATPSWIAQAVVA